MLRNEIKNICATTRLQNKTKKNSLRGNACAKKNHYVYG